MPKDATKNVDRYKIRGGQLNEFEFHQNQEEFADQQRERAADLIPGTPPEARKGSKTFATKKATKSTKARAASATKRSARAAKATAPARATRSGKGTKRGAGAKKQTQKTAKKK